VAGTASGAKDIADSILHAGAAVAQVAAHLERGSGAAGNRQVQGSGAARARQGQTLKVPA
jgi:heterodisulfide reductase subunit A-like polyferredoxin